MKAGELRDATEEERSVTALSEALLTLETAEEVKAFLLDLCTPAELQALADRWRVVGLLEEGLPYRDIHDRTGVSVTTIGRVARFMHQGFGGYALARRRLGDHRRAR